MIATPELAPYPVGAFLKPSVVEQSGIAEKAQHDEEKRPCAVLVSAGIFFDGTNNNRDRDRSGVRTGVPVEGTDTPTKIASRKLHPEEMSHSNVVRLFLAYPQNANQGYHSFYIPGPGTPFPEINEFTESSSGKAFAKGGQPRIIWGLFQALNAVHLTISGKSIYPDKEIGEMALAYAYQVGVPRRDAGDSSEPVTHRDWFAPHILKLAVARGAQPKPAIPLVSLSVFGFSRGAAEAAAFCHLFEELLEDGKLAGIPAEIKFLGVFDTVATVGGSASVARTLPLPGALFDGHWTWANHILKPLPACVKAGAHYIASHELRMNFPVTRLSANCGDNFKEIYFPGVHSDSGGGYAPGEYGKSIGSQGLLLSQIPLAHMFKAARLAGVPFKPFSELEQAVRNEFEIKPELASAWNAYTTELGKNGHLLTKHMELYYRWRAARLHTLEDTASFKAASAQAQQDMRDANRMLAGDLEALELRRKSRPQGSTGWPEPAPKLDPTYVNQWHLERAHSREPFDQWEAWATSIFRAPQPLPPDVMRFFDDYVHDSFAGFYLAGEVTEYDKRAKVIKVLKKPRSSWKGFDLKIYDLAKKTEAAVAKKKHGESLSTEEEALAKEAEYGTPYPVMTDADTADMRSVAIKTQTDTRREGGGYIIRRGYYPHSGFFRRESIHEKELRTLPKVGSVRQGAPAGAAVVELVWSDNLLADVALAAMRTQSRQEPSEAALA